MGAVGGGVDKGFSNAGLMRVENELGVMDRVKVEEVGDG